MFRRITLFAAKALLCITTLMPFVGLAEPNAPTTPANSRGDISLSLNGYLPTSSLNRGIRESGSDSAGVMASARYSFARYATFEVNYGHARSTAYFNSAALPALKAAVHTGVHEVTGAYVFNLPARHALQGFILAGGGALQFNPITAGTNIGGTHSQSKPAVLLGAGVNYSLSRHLGLRLQYRSLLYALPSFKVEALRTNGVQAASEPTLGVVYRF